MPDGEPATSLAVPARIRFESGRGLAAVPYQWPNLRVDTARWCSEKRATRTLGPSRLAGDRFMRSGGRTRGGGIPWGPLVTPATADAVAHRRAGRLRYLRPAGAGG